MNAEEVINSRFAIAVALGIGRVLPRAIGYRFADFMGNRIASRSELEMVQAVRANQWVVGEGGLSSKQLDQVVHDTFRHTARCLYEMYHVLHSIEAMQNLVEFSTATERLMQRIERREEGTLVVGIHMSNFDLVARATAARGLRVLALAYPDPGGAYQWQNEQRRESGLELVPASMGTMKKAARELAEGGTVVTGIDRPIPGANHRPHFFGQRATLPIHHVLLAQRAEVPIFVAASIMQDDGRYLVEVSEPVSMRKTTDRRKTMLENAERVLEQAEEFIRRAPYQWSMFYPVWPEVLDKVSE